VRPPPDQKEAARHWEATRRLMIVASVLAIIILLTLAFQRFGPMLGWRD
jgi:hypothetical protein